MKEITIAFRKVKKDSSIISKIIGWKEKANYSHVEIAFEETSGVYKSLVALPENKVLIYKNRFFKKDSWDIMKLEVTDEQYETAREICDGYIGAKYDLAGILGFITPFKDRADEWFCSEATSNTLKCIGYEPMRYIEASDVGIRELLDILDFNSNKLNR